jgi:DDB1- and CUL4-associated factor 7
MPNLVVISSIGMTSTVWNLDTSTMVTQLIAHDSDVAWLPNSTDIFVSAERTRLTGHVDLRSLKYELSA